MRADATRNRAKLLEVAAAQILDNPGVTLQAVASSAGVGIGTLYRHFATREHLLLALYEHEMSAMSDLADDLLSIHPPFEALSLWLHEFALYGSRRPGLADAFRMAGVDTERHATTYDAAAKALQRLLGQARESGSVKPDIGADDVIVAVCGLWALPDSLETKVQAARVTLMILDGIRNSQPPVEPTAVSAPF